MAAAITIERISSCSLIPRSTICTRLAFTAWPKDSRKLERRPKARGLDHAEGLGLLLEYELPLRRQKQFETRARVARLRHSASVEDVNYQSPRGLDRALFLKLTACDWIAERRNLLITGASGAGSPVPSATRRAQRTCPFSTPACPGSSPISPSPTATRATPGSCAPWRAPSCSSSMTGVRRRSRPTGARFAGDRRDRYDKGSLIITSQVPVDHNAYRIELAGESLRKRRSSP